MRAVESDPAVLRDAAAMLRALAKAAPGQNAVERRIARRIEGAAVALDVAAQAR